MSLQIVNLALCPFCQRGHGGIYVNAVALAEWFQHKDGDGPRNLAEEVDQQIVLINNANTLTEGPCEHLVQLTLALDCGVIEDQAWRSRAGVSFDWLSPVVKNADPEYVATRYLWDNVPLDDEAEIDWVETPHRVSDFMVSWPGLEASHHDDLHFQAQGSVAFAKNVGAFVEELKAADDVEWMVWQRCSQNPANAS